MLFGELDLGWFFKIGLNFALAMFGICKRVLGGLVCS